MSLSAPATRTEIPSWVISVILHATLVAVLLYGVRSCELSEPNAGLIGNPNDQYRAFGLLQKSEEKNKKNKDETSQTDPNETPVKQQDPDQSFQKKIPDQPPTKDNSLVDTNRIAGPGKNKPLAGGTPNTGDPLKGFSRPNKISLPGSQGVPTGNGPSQFFGAKVEGNKVVFVMDISASMQSEAAPDAPAIIRYAQSELIKNLRSLNANQYFAVIFYNEDVTMLDLGDRGGVPKNKYLFAASDRNVRAAEAEVMTVRPRKGTQHYNPLVKALSLKPDAIFFLTDGDTPGLQSWQLDQLRTQNRRLNNAKTRIHAIELGRFGKPTGDNFLKKLSEQHKGSYHYVNLSRLARQR